MRPAPNEHGLSDKTSVSGLVYKIAEALVAEHGDALAEAYRNTNENLMAITLSVFPEMPPNHANICRAAVGVAIRQVVGRGEREALTKARRSRLLKDRITKDPETHKLNAAKATVSRKANGTKANMENTWLTKGIIPWKPDEREKLLELSDNPSFQHKEGSLLGKPNYELLAAYLNENYHNGEQVRKADKLGGVIRSYRYDKKTKET